MARNFNGSTDKLTVANAVVGDTPCTLAAWIRPTTVSGFHTILDLGNNATLNNHFTMRTDGSTLDVAHYVGSAAEATKTTVSANTWQHAAGVLASGTSRTAYLNGSAGTENTTSKGSLTGENQTSVGMLVSGSDYHAFSGRIFLPSVWNVALNATDLAILQYCHPLFVKPQNLVSCWELVGSELVDIVGGNTLTNSGTTVAANPPISLLWPGSVAQQAAEIVAAAEEEVPEGRTTPITDTTAYPAFASKAAALLALRTAIERRNLTATWMALFQISNTDTDDWTADSTVRHDA